MIRIREVIKGGQIDCENANRRDANGNGGDDPMHAAETGPAKHEQADWHASTLHTRKVQSAFRRVCQLAVRARDLLLVYGQNGRDDAGDAHACEDGVGLLQAEVVVCLEHKRYSSEREVQHGPGESHPETEPEDDGFGEEEVEGAVETERNHFGEGSAVFVGADFPADALGYGSLFGRGLGHVEAVVSGCFAVFVVFVEDFGFSREKDRATGFFEDDDDERDHDAVGDGLYVEDPAP